MHALRLLRKTPFRTFILYPSIAIAWELFLNRDSLKLEPIFLPLMLWGFLQYRLCGLYRIKHGGGGPGLETPPERLVATGPYAYTRNPMYLGHIIFLIGLTLTLKSPFAALITAAAAIWFHFRVLDDERRLAQRLGEPYIQYVATVKRWLPGLF
ncbi:MAG: isoprenylcysteine carboxylmethyltransferase family protein [Deltaproteobacteria bacterium]|nr:isoprenylcysteine carboxylmethyltransferase family protein [Deltaproteobacteria bacterium]